MDPVPDHQLGFWRAPGRDPKQIDTEVFLLPTTHWIERTAPS